MANTYSQIPSPAISWVDGQGKPTQVFTQFMTALASGKIALTSAANDAAAKAAGVSIGQFYQSSGAVRVRIT